MIWSARKKTALGLLVGLGVFSFGAWDALTRAVLIEEASSFLVPSLWFALFFLFLLTGAILWQEKLFSALAALVAVAPSLLQALSLWHALLVIISGALVFCGLRRVQQELGERLHVSVRRSLLSGMTLLVLGVSVTLSSQYFVHAETLSWERLVPSFDLAEGTGPLLLRMMKPLYPGIDTLQDKTVTVDSFLHEVQINNNTAMVEAPLEVQNMFWEQELARTKKELGRLLGREVIGTENMQVILAEVLRKKTITLFSNESTKLPIPILPFFLSFLLFLTLYPLLAFLVPFIGILAHGLFQMFLALGWVKRSVVSVEQEIIEV